MRLVYQLKMLLQASLAPPISLLRDIMCRLELKGEAFEVYNAATEDEIFQRYS